MAKTETGSEHPVSLCHWGPLTAEIADGRLIRARPWGQSGADPAMIGAIPELVYSPTRIDRPHVREGYLRRPDTPSGNGRGGEPMVPVSWETALGLAADALARTRAAHGPEAIFGGSYGWSSAGRFHHARSQLRRFLAATGGFTDQIGNYSWGAAQTLLPYVLGDHRSVSSAATPWQSVIDYGDLVLAFGGLNPKNWRVTSGGAGIHDLPELTRRARARGVRFVVVSPSADDAPDWLNAERLAPRPNTDTALMLALSYEAMRRGRADRSFLDRCTTGFDTLAAYLDGRTDGVAKTLAWAAGIADVPAADLVRLADRVLGARRVLVTASWSLQRARHGEMPFWATIALAAVLGQIGLEGGGFGFGYGSMNAVGGTARPGFIPSSPSLANPAASAIPVARVIDMLERPGTSIPFAGRRVTLPHARLVYWAGGNPFHHVQDLNRAARAWARPETVIVHEPWWTPTARRADIVLPATSFAERNDIGGNSRDPFVFAMPKLIEPLAQARDDWQILAELADRLGARQRFTDGLDETGWLRRLWAQTEGRAESEGLAAPTFDDFWAHGHWAVPAPESSQILLERFRADPEGQKLATPSGRIELFSRTIAALDLADCPGHPAWLPPEEWLGTAGADELHLVTRQPADRLHSQLYQTRLNRGGSGSGPEDLTLNPADAAARGIEAGDRVVVENARGRCLATAVLDPGLRCGVAVMATGAWWQPDPDAPLLDRVGLDRAGLDRAGLDRAGNPNVLTADRPTSSLTQACAALSALVTVRPCPSRAGDERHPR